MGLGRTVRRIATGGLLVAAASALGLLYVLRQPVPRIRGRLSLKGLWEGGEVIRDRWGVPHIYAKNLHDLFFAMGYAQAQDRLWQMDFNRRAASGTLSETLGEAALPIDRLVRRVGFRRLAEQEWSRAPEEERAVLEAYAAGVNAFISRRRFPLEFRILRSRPAHWDPVDTLAFGHFFMWALAGNWDSEIIRSWTIERFGAELMAQLDPKYPEGGPLVVPPGAGARGVGPEVTGDFRESQQIAGLVGQAMSNNWAVDGEKSVSGRPLLASDPHLPLGIPPLWWEVHLESPQMRAAGVGLPGIPGVLMGHNDRIAWGMTAAIVDGDDLFVEQVNPENPSQYRYKGKWVNGTSVREEIKVRGRSEAVVEDVLVTRHGPIVSPAIKGETRTLALRTVAAEPSHQVRAMLRLMGARDWDEFREALSMWPAPSLNFGYADVDGNIGYHLAGLVPLRAKGYGVVPMPGWSGEYEWTGFVPFHELPHAYNPKTHWIASANNRIADEDYPHFLSASYADRPRQERIIQMLEAKEKLAVEDFKAMQVDLLSLPAKDLVPLILSVRPRDEWGRRALTFVRAWDQRVAPDSAGACVFEVFFTHLVRGALEEKLGSWSDFFMGKGIHPLRQNGLFFGVAHGWLMDKIRKQPEWFEAKTWDEAMEEALAAAVAELRERLGDEVSRWQWGRLHRQWFRHPLGQARGLHRIFNRGPVPLGGDANTVWQAGYAPYHGYDQITFAPSWRQIIDLSDFNRSQAVLPTGESGHPGSAHYQDMLRMWQHGQYHPMAWDREEVERVATSRQELAGET